MSPIYDRQGLTDKVMSGLASVAAFQSAPVTMLVTKARRDEVLICLVLSCIVDTFRKLMYMLSHLASLDAIVWQIRTKQKLGSLTSSYFGDSPGGRGCPCEINIVWSVELIM